MGTPDVKIETPQGTVFLDLKTVHVQGKTRPLPTVREWNPRFPRKLKKKLKKYHGENYYNWLNLSVKWVPELNSNIYSYHNVYTEKELTQLLNETINNENNKKN